MMIAAETVNIPEHIIGRILLGGNLGLDFCNTVDDRLTETPTDHLHDYADLVYWGVHTQSLTGAQALDLLQAAQRDSAAAAAVLQAGKSLREAIYTIALHTSEGTPPAEAVETFNGLLGQALQHRCLNFTADAPQWTWRADQPVRLDAVLWEIAAAAADVFVNGQRERLRPCPGCGWLYYDHSSRVT